jgi:hypothetical protein
VTVFARAATRIALFAEYSNIRPGPPYSNTPTNPICLKMGLNNGELAAFSKCLQCAAVLYAGAAGVSQWRFRCSLHRMSPKARQPLSRGALAGAEFATCRCLSARNGERLDGRRIGPVLEPGGDAGASGGPGMLGQVLPPRTESEQGNRTRRARGQYVESEMC